MFGIWGERDKREVRVREELGEYDVSGKAEMSFKKEVIDDFLTNACLLFCL